MIVREPVPWGKSRGSAFFFRQDSCLELSLPIYRRVTACIGDQAAWIPTQVECSPSAKLSVLTPKRAAEPVARAAPAVLGGCASIA